MDDLATHLASLLARDKTAAFDASTFEQLVLAYIDHNGRTWMQCKAVLREFKVLKDYEPRIRVRANELRDVPSISRDRSGITLIKDVWKDAPIDSEAEPPSGWGIDDPQMAVYRKEQKTQDGQTFERRVCVSYDPIIITRRIKNVDRGSVMLELAWKTNRWYTGIYDRDTVFNTRDIVKISRDGAPVRSDNAMEVVQWLGAYEHANLRDITIGYATTSMGWKGDESDPTKHGFICGTRQIGGNGKAFELHTLSSGDEAEAASIRSKGTLEGWKNAVTTVAKWPLMRIMILASLASPLLEVLDAPNSIVELVGRTSRGKTQALRVAQSCWRSGAGRPAGWNNTVNNFESKAHLFSGLPLLLDDTRLALLMRGGEEMVSRAIYQFVSGVGRGRDTREGGQRHTQRWRSVLISTGENPSSDLTSAEGAAARVLSFWGSPMGEPDPKTGELVDDLVEVRLNRDYGVAGPAIVKWLADNREDWEALRTEYDSITSKIRSVFSTPSASRLARVVALLEITSLVAHRAGILPWDHSSLFDDDEIVAHMDSSLEQAATGADRMREAWDAMCSYAASRPANWCDVGRTPDANKQPTGGWFGWRDEKRFYWFSNQLRSALKDLGYVPPETVLRAWRDEGILIGRARGKRFTQTFELGGFKDEAKTQRVTGTVICVTSVSSAWSDGDVVDLPSDDG